jgi:hypothetical protein
VKKKKKTIKLVSWGDLADHTNKPGVGIFVRAEGRHSGGVG